MDRRRLIAGAGAAGGLGLLPRPSLAATDAGDAPFPPGFLWGAATAAYQVEGYPHADGKGPSIWDTFSHTPGKIRNGDTGDVACQSYRRYREDAALVRRFNLKSYRYSISWPRIQPTGRGPANAAGLDYYKRLTDAVLETGARPLVTLYHWDLPQALEDEGGWPNRDTVDRLADYADLVARALGDRIDHWAVFNEANAFTSLGYGSGVHAPGRKDPLAYIRATHSVNLGVGAVFRAVKAARPGAKVGTVVDVSAVQPATSSPADVAAAERRRRLGNYWFVQPVLTGAYPAVLPPNREHALLNWRDGDERRMRADLDYVGINYYSRSTAADDPSNASGVPGLNSTYSFATGPDAKTDFDWDIYPQGFYDVLVDMHRLTGDRPIEITENGAAYNTRPSTDGRVHDQARIAYLQSHLREVRRAIAAGVPVRGYHCWSLMDNFEWAAGFSERFGLTYVDFAGDGRRTVKDSGDWYARVAAANRVL